MPDTVQITEYTGLYAVPVNAKGKEDTQTKYNLKSISATFALGYDVNCDIIVIGKATKDKVNLTNLTTSGIKELSKAFRYGERFNVYQTKTKDNKKELLFSGFVFSSGHGVTNSAISVSFGFKVTLASAAKLYDNSYVRSPIYMHNVGSATGPVDVSVQLGIASSSREGQAQVSTIQRILTNHCEQKNITDIVTMGQQVIDHLATKVVRSSNQNPLKIADMFDVDSSPVLNCKVNLFARAAANGKDNQPCQTTLNKIVNPIISNLPSNSDVAVFCAMLGTYNMAVAPRVNTDLKKNLAIVPATGFGLCGNRVLSTGDILGFTKYDAQRQVGSLVNIWMYDTGIAATLATSGNNRSQPIVRLYGGYDLDGNLTVKLYSNANGQPAQNSSSKDTWIGPIQRIALPDWAPPSPSAESKEANKRVQMAKSLCATMFATSGLVAGNLVVALSYASLHKVLNHVGMVFELDTTIGEPPVYDVHEEAYKSGDITEAEIVYGEQQQRQALKQYGRLKQLRYQLECESDRVTASVHCTFDCVLSHAEYTELVDNAGPLAPSEMLVVERNSKE